MAYPGDFVAVNRTARTDAQHAAIRPFLRKKRRTSDRRRACLPVWEWLTKRTLPRIYSRGPQWLQLTRGSTDAVSKKTFDIANLLPNDRDFPIDARIAGRSRRFCSAA